MRNLLYPPNLDEIPDAELEKIAMMSRPKHEAAKLPDIEAVLAREYALGVELVYRADFQEGVKTVLVEKEKEKIPKFEYKSLNQSLLEKIRNLAPPNKKEMMMRGIFMNFANEDDLLR